MAAPLVEGAAAAALRSVMFRARQAAERSGRHFDQVRVVAVSKTKPVSLIRQVYDAAHRCFGENYVQEIIDKAPQLPQDIEWHFIGHLQSNKVKSLLAGVPNLAMVEGVDNEKLANHLDRAVSNLGRDPLKVLVQVNTSGEISKSGVEPSGCIELAKHVKLRCPHLQFSGLMTIGMPDYTCTPENFKTLLNCRAEVCRALEMAEEQCELSMGMSSDFELADGKKMFELLNNFVECIGEANVTQVITDNASANVMIGRFLEAKRPQLSWSPCAAHYLDLMLEDIYKIPHIHKALKRGIEIEMGSTNVRIGSTIFGPREYPKKQAD
ncbi:pyridoxal phosphate homeostasis protein-like isoform X4 [Benincasa hispida]|uniref:pyridoxal phosphate homeostasis protein-like isoform X4 n=1 Tax=Benincasa hispida TaxID=102211 RepID=UPI001900A679|nr:pyridoxal phosphate homeostasis protein-like isoform X4 [Benincasa hispida]